MHTCPKLCKPMMEPLILDWLAECSATCIIYGVYHPLLYIRILLKDSNSEYILLALSLKKLSQHFFPVFSLFKTYMSKYMIVN